MYRITVKIDGMMCSMCEAHICETIRKALPEAKKVKASRRRGEATFFSASAVEEAELRRAIADTGYTVTSICAEP